MYRCFNCQVQDVPYCLPVIFFNIENNHKTSFLMNAFQYDHHKH